MKITFDDFLPDAACLWSNSPLIASLLAPSLLEKPSHFFCHPSRLPFILATRSLPLFNATLWPNQRSLKFRCFKVNEWPLCSKRVVDLRFLWPAASGGGRNLQLSRWRAKVPRCARNLKIFVIGSSFNPFITFAGNYCRNSRNSCIPVPIPAPHRNDVLPAGICGGHSCELFSRTS